jgi:hypothetical protein
MVQHKNKYAWYNADAMLISACNKLLGPSKLLFSKRLVRLQLMSYLEGSVVNSFREIYSPPNSRCYDDYIRKIKSINKTLRKEGVLAPGDKAFENVKKLYNAIGGRLDAIPVVHVGGTNGKVGSQYLFNIKSSFHVTMSMFDIGKYIIQSCTSVD